MKKKITVTIGEEVLDSIGRLLTEMKQEHDYHVSKSSFIEACIKSQRYKGINFEDNVSLRSMEIFMGKYDD